MIRTFVPFLFVLALLAACGGADKPVDPKEAAAAHALEGARRIKVMEDSLFNDSAGFDPRGAQALVDVYLAFAKAHPLDSLASEYLFRAASVKRSLKDPKGSIALYDRIIRDYGWSPKIPDAYYLKAFIIDSDLGQKGEAKRAYEEMIRRYPDHPFAEDSKRMISYLGMSDAEILQRFERMADSTKVGS